jgi:hypothetical protein
MVGDQMTLASECAMSTTKCSDCNADTPCGGFMPFDGELLAKNSPDLLCTIQSWISQGAKNN